MRHITADNFEIEVIKGEGAAVVMFYADWCAKCAMMKPIAEEMEEKYREDIVFYEAEIEECPDLAAEYEADIVPTFVTFSDGQIIGVMQGVIDEEIFELRLQDLLRNSSY